MTGQKINFAVFYHLHFPDLVPELLWIMGRFDMGAKKYVSVTDNVPQNLISVIEASLPGVKIINVTNGGRDIKPFLDSIKIGLLDDFDWVLKIHGKKSSHREDGDYMRRRWTEILAPEVNPTSLVEEVLQDCEEVRLLAPQECLIKAKASNWVSNAQWLKQILDRINNRDNAVVDIKDWDYPILAGSFYWISKNGINFLKGLPVTGSDWDRSAEKGAGFDGGLEHAIERLMLMDLNSSATKSKSSIIKIFKPDNNDSVIFKNIRCFNPFVDHPKYYKQNVDRILKDCVNFLKKRDFLFNVEITYGPNRTFLDCILFDAYNKLSSGQKLEVRIKGLPVRTLDFTLLYEPMFCPGLLSGQYRSQIEIYGKVDPSDIQIAFPNDFHALVPIPRSTITTVARRAAFLSYQSTSALVQSESLRLNHKPASKIFRENRVLASQFGLKCDAFWRTRKNINQPKFHCFVINSSYTAVSAIRTIEYLKIESDRVFIIFHRIKPIKLLDVYPYIETGIADLEVALDSASIEICLAALLRVQNFFPTGIFALYSYHYYSLFVSALAWSPFCCQVNLLEEGNLNFSELHQTHRVMGLLEIEFLVEKLGYITLKPLNYFLYSDIYRRHGNLFEFKGKLPYSYIVQGQLDFLNLECLNKLRRTYFYHPKMAIGNTYFRPSGIFLDSEFLLDHNQVALVNASAVEGILRKQYFDLVAERASDLSVVLVLPGGLIDKKRIISAIKSYSYKLNYKRMNIYFLKHPAANTDFNWQALVEFFFMEALPAHDFQVSPAPDGVVSDIFCSVFDVVFHCSSSIVRIASMLSKDTQYLNLNSTELSVS